MINEMDVEKFKCYRRYVDEMLLMLKDNVRYICNEVIKKYGSKYIRILSDPYNKINPLDDYYLYENMNNYVNENGFHLKLKSIDNKFMFIDVYDEDWKINITNFKFPVKLLYLNRDELSKEIDNIIKISKGNL